MSDPIKVLIVDDHRMLAEALEVLLAGEDGLEAMGTAGTADEALEMCRRVCPDVVLMDIDLPGTNGIEATARLLEICPGARVVAMTALRDQDLLADAVRAGASGFVPKTRAADELVGVVRRAAAGEIILPSGDVAGILWRLKDTRQLQLNVDRRFNLLTPREIEVLQAFAQGRSTREVAQDLVISPKTVQSHVERILTKLEVHSKLDAVVLALRHGVLRLDPQAAETRPV
jgi:DNA-binding NarL/FixJ family response regulator